VEFHFLQQDLQQLKQAETHRLILVVQRLEKKNKKLEEELAQQKLETEEMITLIEFSLKTRMQELFEGWEANINNLAKQEKIATEVKAC
jgi:hypothetical protein